MTLGRQAVWLLAVNAVLWAWTLLVPVRVLEVRRLPGGALGMALPGLVLLTRAGWCRAVLRHELAHQRQMRRWSPLGAALALAWHYGLAPLGQLLRRGRAPGLRELYRTCPLEREANAAMVLQHPLERVWGRIPEN